MFSFFTFSSHTFKHIIPKQMCLKKSKVITSRPSIAVAIANKVTSGKLTEDYHAKYLGTDSVGGKVRCTVMAVARLGVSHLKCPRFHALRQMGLTWPRW